ncbi:DUF4062 domain-containing protein [Pantoea sp. Cy-640]|jgi:hypothetical protein|uniref:DUF4062 domain-containing protein n=1 Tax=Pantoea sp. Cy-640 TaxID=2608353 RepID=UPI00141A40AA|nr:DUF4062 domain-containing protein [Pantoea sp. Cy-640]NIG14528.1 DUF4062 domain-containing protein [Pantoea sp. Cy-640]
MDKRYQVFVSSTFTDLEDERRHVIQTLMEMDCIPAGMELFPAIDEEQWEFIKKVIDDCDYYLLIIGGRYGSTAEDGLSYTEKEFDYAVEKGLKVTVLLHHDPDSLPAKKTESIPESKEKLLRFIEKAQKGRLRKTWKSVEELPGLVALSMTKTIRMHPAVGWVRADKIASEDNLSELIKAKKEIETLKKSISKIKEIDPKDHYGNNLAGLEDEHLINYMKFYPEDYLTEHHKTISFKLGFIFDRVAPKAQNGCSEASLIMEISSLIEAKMTDEIVNTTVYTDDIITLRMHFIALGLIDFHNSWWSLTEKGVDQMIRRRIIRK